jgi:hypothetical protein
MISPKLAVLMATFAMIGVGLTASTPLASATILMEDPSEDQNASVDIERNNEIDQSIDQEQEACTNEAEVSVSDDDFVQVGDNENEAEVEQENDCFVDQDQDATNTAAIVDSSENTFDIDQILARLNLGL